jgi:hypothetical protein
MKGFEVLTIVRGLDVGRGEFCGTVSITSLDFGGWLAQYEGFDDATVTINIQQTSTGKKVK